MDTRRGSGRVDSMETLDPVDLCSGGGVGWGDFPEIYYRAMQLCIKFTKQICYKLAQWLGEWVHVQLVFILFFCFSTAM